MKTMLFSVSYAGLWGQHKLDLPAFIRKAGALGYDAVELVGKRPHLSVLDYDDGALAELRSTADEAGVQIGTIAGYNDFTGGAAAEVPFVEIQVAYVRELCRAAEKLGASLVRIFSGYFTNVESVNPDWDRCVAAVRECAEVAADHGVAIGLQNHHDVAVGFDAYAEFLDEVGHENCRAMFDPWSIALHGEDLRRCARVMAPRMAQTTLADYVRLKRFAYMPGLINYRPAPDMVRAVPVGDGFIDSAAFLEGLREGGFDGYVCYEMCSPLRGGGSEENLDATATKSLAAIRDMMG